MGVWDGMVGAQERCPCLVSSFSQSINYHGNMKVASLMVHDALPGWPGITIHP